MSKISELPVASSLTGVELIEIVQGGVSKSAPVSIIPAYKNAYDLAVSKGFIGTEAEWLLSLVGPTGTTGATGPKGDTGATGLDSLVPGPQGAQGVAGPQGIQGEVGPQGLTGPAGPQGPAGADSTVEGPQGPQGTQGIQGETGPQGVQGIQGIPGADSIIPGPDGPQGVQGADGVSNIPGPQGPKGDTGLQGIQGLTGADGVSNIPGPQGDTGPAGPQGIQGLPGAEGPQGPQGIQGPAGTPAPIVTYPFTAQLTAVDETCVASLNKGYFVVPFDMDIKDIWIDAFVCNFGSTTDPAVKLTVDVKVSGVSIFNSVYMLIDFMTGSSTSSATPNPNMVDTMVAKGERITFDIIEAPAVIDADIKGLIVTIVAQKI